MPIVDEKFVPSKKNYAVKWDSFREENNHYKVDSIWGFQKSGKLYVSMGTLDFYSLNSLTIDEFRDGFDNRYGGWAKCTWDGIFMTSQKPIALNEMVKYSEILDSVLNNLPKLPNGYDGWYRLSA